ncbi:MAG: hypothetical protein HYS26_04310 [Candidatus Kaiserbacteria bacterium]|nr:MAG: hypothetical protein HYS26_04310 [Candidatus Kaiserbacteria bacterium]
MRKHTSQGGRAASDENARAGQAVEEERYGVHPGDVVAQPQQQQQQQQVQADAAGPSDTSGMFHGEHAGRGVRDPDTGNG